MFLDKFGNKDEDIKIKSVDFAKKDGINSKANKERLENFITNFNIEQTDNGKLILYKAVKNDLTSKQDRLFQYKVGEYKTETVDENPDENCSTGIHAGTLQYAQNFGDDLTIALKDAPIKIDGVERYSDILFNKDENLIKKYNGDVILRLLVDKEDIFVPKAIDSKVRCRKVFVDDILLNEEVDIFKKEIKLSIKKDFYENPKVYFEIYFDNIKYEQETYTLGYNGEKIMRHYLGKYIFSHYIEFENINDITDESIKLKINELIKNLHNKYQVVNIIKNCKINLYGDENDEK